MFRFPAKYPFESTVDLMVHGAPSGWVFLTDMPRTAKPCTYENFVGKIKVLKKADPVTFVSNDDGYFGWDAKHYIQNKQVTEEEWNQKQH